MKPVTRDDFAKNLSGLLKLSDMNPSLYSTHSFRIGRATDLAAEGYPSEVLKASGRWTSMRLQRL